MTATVVRRRVVTMATTHLVAALCLPMVSTGTFACCCLTCLPCSAQYLPSGLLTCQCSAPTKQDRAPQGGGGGSEDDDGAINPGSNLFVTGIHPRLEETEVTRLFEKYGEVEKCQIMKDPHTGESRGFGFVKMVTSIMADAAKEGLQGEMIEGRTLSIEKARRARPRTPTPGKYFGPPKRGKCYTTHNISQYGQAPC